MLVTMQPQDALIAWAEPIMGVDAGCMPPETIALGVVDDAGQIRCVWAFNAFYSHYASVHIASDGSRSWLTRPVLRAIFGYAFEHLGLQRLNAIIPAARVPAQILALKLGFEFEGRTRCGADDGSDGIVLGMLASQCRWLTEVDHGQKSPQS